MSAEKRARSSSKRPRCSAASNRHRPLKGIVALDGVKCDVGGLVSRCEDRKPGEQVRVTVFRRDKLVDVALTLGAKPTDAVYLSRVDRPSDAQQAAWKSWLGASWEEAEKPLADTRPA